MERSQDKYDSLKLNQKRLALKVTLKKENVLEQYTCKKLARRSPQWELRATPQCQDHGSAASQTSGAERNGGTSLLTRADAWGGVGRGGNFLYEKRFKADRVENANSFTEIQGRLGAKENDPAGFLPFCSRKAGGGESSVDLPAEQHVAGDGLDSVPVPVPVPVPARGRAGQSGAARSSPERPRPGPAPGHPPPALPIVRRGHRAQPAPPPTLGRREQRQQQPEAPRAAARPPPPLHPRAPLAPAPPAGSAAPAPLAAPRLSLRPGPARPARPPSPAGLQAPSAGPGSPPGGSGWSPRAGGEGAGRCARLLLARRGHDARLSRTCRLLRTWAGAATWPSPSAASFPGQACHEGTEMRLKLIPVPQGKLRDRRHLFWLWK